MTLIRLHPAWMTTDPARENKRRGFWLRMARERANLSQATVAQEIGLSTSSKSTLSAWEAGEREPKLRYLKAMAALYALPLEWFTNPRPTAYEEIDGWLAGLASQALSREAAGWQAGDPDPALGAAPDERPREQSA